MDDTRKKPKTAEAAETMFYESFRTCDVDMMAALWARSDVVCIHPGSDPIVGYESVIRSWRNIFSNALPPKVTVTIVKRFNSDELATSVVIEDVSSGTGDTALVLATNVYKKIDGHWQMVEHHGSLLQSRPQKYTIQ